MLEQNIWFSSDPHYGHTRVIEFSHRPFKDVLEMREALIQNWNERVKPNDLAYILGDVFFCKKEEAISIASRLNGRKFWIFGNHDNKSQKWKELTSLFEWCGISKEIEIRDPQGEYRSNSKNPRASGKECNKIRLFHEPIFSWAGMHKLVWHLHGHCHNSYKPKVNKILDVGVDSHNYCPISYQQVKKYMMNRQFVPVDGHGLGK